MRFIVLATTVLVAAVLGLIQAPAGDTGQRADQADARGRTEQAFRANNAGVADLEQFDYAAAAAEFRRALTLDPSLHIVRVNLALALHYGGQPEAALTEALAAAAALPGEPRAWFAAGLAARATGDDPAAIRAFEQVLRIDPADAASLLYLGQVHLQAGDGERAAVRFAAVAAAEPFNATAVYGLAMALLRSNRSAEGQKALDRFQVLRDAPYVVTYADAYLQQGRYGEALVSTGNEAALIDPETPAVRFADVTAAAVKGGVPEAVSAVTLFDADGDADLDLLTAGAAGTRLFRRGAGGWQAADILGTTAAAVGAVAADYDNDGRTDVALLADKGMTLWRQVETGRYENVTDAAGLTPAAGGRTAAFTDLDHDGDVDFVSAGARLDAWRNNGNGTFTRFDPSVGLADGPGDSTAMVPTDFDSRRDMDLILTGSAGVMLFRNQRDGRFERSPIEAAAQSGPMTAAGTGDVNADGRTDLFLGRAASAGLLLTSRGSGGFTVSNLPDTTHGAQAAHFIDYDGDGALDLVTLGSRGLRVHRRVGTTWTDVSGAARTSAQGCATACALASADVDTDGDIDLVTVESGRLRVWQNEATATRAVSVDLEARVSNRSALGARVEMRAGSLLRRFEVAAASPAPASAGVTFALGSRERADVVRVIWPSGIVQAETPGDPVKGHQAITITELDRKPSSCPYLFTWNGTRFEFVTDFLGGGELGYWLAPGVRNVPDPEEYVRIRGDQLVERDGRYELRVTNELEEALFVDRLSLLAVTHRAGTEVFPNEGLFGPPYPAHRLFVTRGATVPPRVVDEHGHDVRELVTRVDRQAPSDFPLERFRGYAREHYIEVDAPVFAGPKLLLLLTAWTDYAFSSDNVAASQAGMALRPPSLEMANPDGSWRTVLENIGIPVGRPQTVVVDLSGRVPPGARLRIRTNMRIYWDQVLFDTSAGEQVRPERIEPLTADLRWRGYSAEISPDGREPFRYDYSRVSPDSPWKLMPGRYTREGDVLPLLTATDDRFIVSRPGDEVAVAFRALPPPPPGWTRTFLLHANGYSKEMDANSSSPDVAAPLPYRGMPDYPYDPAVRALSPELRAYIERYNTRVVTRTVPLLAGPRPLKVEKH